MGHISRKIGENLWHKLYCTCAMERNTWMCTSRRDHGLGLTLTLSSHGKNYRWKIMRNFLSFYNIIIVVVTEYVFLFVMFSSFFIPFLSKSDTFMRKIGKRESKMGKNESKIGKNYEQKRKEK